MIKLLSKKLILIIFIIFFQLSSAFAYYSNNFLVHYPNLVNTPGFYIRGEIGFQLVNPDSATATIYQSSLTVNINRSENVIGRVAAGYAWYFFGLESGFTWLNPVYRQFHGVTFNGPGISTSSALTHTNLYAIDLLAKLTLTYESFYTFLAGGGAYLHEQFPALLITLSGSVPTTQITLWPANSLGLICPKAAVGAGYNFSLHWALDASFYYLFGRGNITNGSYLPDLSAVSLNVAYKF